MKKLMLVSASLVAIAVGPAIAADLPMRPTYKALPPAPVMPAWTGFYGGVNVGYSWGRDRTDYTATAGGFVFTATESQKIEGAVGGVQWGYNWQFGNYVLGTESDIQLSGQRGSTTYCFDAACATNINASHRLSWFGTARTRLGILPIPTLLLYATGGVAYGEVKADYTANFLGVAVGTAGYRDTRAGYALGAGVEGMLGGGWTARAEYLYIDLGRNTFTATAGGAATFQVNSRVYDHIGRAGINYKFGGGGI